MYFEVYIYIIYIYCTTNWHYYSGLSAYKLTGSNSIVGIEAVVSVQDVELRSFVNVYARTTHVRNTVDPVR